MHLFVLLLLHAGVPIDEAPPAPAPASWRAITVDAIEPALLPSASAIGSDARKVSTQPFRWAALKYAGGFSF